MGVQNRKTEVPAEGVLSAGKQIRWNSKLNEEHAVWLVEPRAALHGAVCLGAEQKKI